MLSSHSENDGPTEAQHGTRDSAAYLAAIVDSSNDAIISKTLEGIITSWNRGAESMYGYSTSEATGRHISLIIPPSQLDELTEALSRVKRGEKIEPYHTKRLHKDQSLLDVSVTISPIRDLAGLIIGASAIGRDITDQLALERERYDFESRLRQSERLESLGQLAGGIAHDFNNLLAVILNYTDFVSEELDDQRAAQADLGQIRTAAVRAGELTRQLLAFARREVQQPQVVNLNEIAAEMEQLLRRTLGEHIELVTSAAKNVWPVLADPGQLGQVLINLAVNARDAMPEGGVLTIETENLEIDATAAEDHPGLSAGHYVLLQVSDTGLGIEPAVLEHVFEPFYTTKVHGEGTGLGLPMAFGIVTQAGGEIQLSSEPGVGTTCRVLLPRTEETSSNTRFKSEPVVVGGNETVLVVEDEDALREVTRRILSRNGYQVLTSSNGPDALALVEAHQGVIHLLLTDVIMPHMFGKEVATLLRQLRPGLPVLYMSGYAQPVLGSTLGDGVALVEKPFSEQVLLGKVRTSLDQGSWLENEDQ